MATLPVYDVPLIEPAEKKQMEKTSRVISFIYLISLAWAAMVCILLLVVLLISISFPSERKLISGTVVGVLVIILSVTLFILRKDPDLSIVFSWIVGTCGGIAFGISLQYI